MKNISIKPYKKYCFEKKRFNLKRECFMYRCLKAGETTWSNNF